MQGALRDVQHVAVPDGFDHGLRTILQLRARGMKDIGFGITLSDRNADDLLELYELADAMGVESETTACSRPTVA
jgi:hypothetical protein